MSVKNDVLKILETNKGKDVSGNDIANQLNVTRTAIWKAITSLKNEGYNISAVNKKGYCFNEDNDILSKESIMPYVINKDLFNDIIVYKSVESTNIEAKQLANASAKSGTVVISEEQTAGRGRLGRKFFSPDSTGIYMSVILRLDTSINDSILITSGAAVAVCKAIKKVCDIDCKIKWVNDVYIENKKVCGILTEASINFENNQLDYIVIGIGINVSANNFPSELKDIITTVEENNKGEKISRSKLIGEVLNEIEVISNDLITKNFIADYRNLSFIIGSEVNVISPTTSEICTAIDINENGHLIVKDSNGNIKEISSGEISIRKL